MIFRCIFIFIIFFQCNVGIAQTKAKEPVQQDKIESAKLLFAQGKRNEAITMIERIKSKTKNKNEIEELEKKKKLFFEQFLTTESYQSYQDAKLFFQADRPSECLREIEKIQKSDQDNKLVLIQKGLCLKGNQQYELAEKEFTNIYSFESNNTSAILELAENSLLQNKIEEGFSWLSKVNSTLEEDDERHTILYAKLLIASNKEKAAIEILRTDSEKHLNHFFVHYELGVLYQKQTAMEWHARKHFTLFINRCKRLNADKIKEKKSEKACKDAQDQLEIIEKKLST